MEKFSVQGFFLQLFDEKGMLMPGVKAGEMVPFPA